MLEYNKSGDVDINKNVDVFEKSEIIENSKIDKEIKSTGVVVYKKNRCLSSRFFFRFCHPIYYLCLN